MKPRQVILRRFQDAQLVATGIGSIAGDRVYSTQYGVIPSPAGSSFDEAYLVTDAPMTVIRKAAKMHSVTIPTQHTGRGFTIRKRNPGRARRTARGRVRGRPLRNSAESDRKPMRAFTLSGVRVEWFQGYAEDVRYLRASDGKKYSHVVETDAAELYLCSHPEFGHCLLIVDPSGRTPLWK